MQKLWVEPLSARMMFSVDLFADINPGATGSSPLFLFDVNGTVYFTADDGVHGNEMFVSSDGSSFHLLKDINPTGSSMPSGFCNVNGTFFFAANDGVHGIELWKTDGTEAGTVMVSDINSTAAGASSNPAALTSYNGQLWFDANDGVHGQELWRSDGTTTTMVQDIRPGSTGSIPQNFTVFNGRLYFAANDGVTGNELRSIGPTDSSATLVSDLWTLGVNAFGPSNLAEYNGNLYFNMTDNTNGFELWKTDGTTGGTSLVKDINPSGNSMPQNFRVYNGLLYFQAAASSSDTELWRTDGTAAGTQLVKDIAAGTTGSGPSLLTVMNGSLYFIANNVTNGSQLWKTDGTAANTQIVKLISPVFGANITWLVPFNNRLYMSCNDGSNGQELYRSDGTDSGTALVRNINPGSAASSPVSLRAINGALYFFANDGSHGNELWKLAPPAVTLSSFDVNGPAMSATFGENVALSTNPADYIAQNVSTLGLYQPTSVSYDSATHRGTFVMPKNLPDGNYQLALPQSAVADVYGNPIAANVHVDFFVLSADANHDRTVDTLDFNALAANFGKTGVSYSQADFNYDNVVDTLDFNALAAQFGKTLPPAASVNAFAPATAAAPGSSTEALALASRREEEGLFSDRLIDGVVT